MKIKPTHSTPKRVLLIALTLVISLSTVVGSVYLGRVFAKYLESTSKPGTIEADPFYFTVDLLGDTLDASDTARTIDLYGGGTQELPFTVQNFFDALRKTPGNTAFSVTVATTGTVSGVTLTREGADITSGGYTGTLASGAKENYKLVIPAGGYENNATVTVTVKSTTPYEKEMTLTFLLHTFEHELLFRIEDTEGSPTATLVVMSNVKIDDPSKIFMDWSAVNKDGNLLQIDMHSIYIQNADHTYPTANDPSAQGGYLKTAVSTHPMRELESFRIDFFKIDPNACYATDGDIGVDEIGGKYTIKIEQKGEDPTP